MVRVARIGPRRAGAFCVLVLGASSACSTSEGIASGSGGAVTGAVTSTSTGGLAQSSGGASGGNTATGPLGGRPQQDNGTGGSTAPVSAGGTSGTGPSTTTGGADTASGAGTGGTHAGSGTGGGVSGGTGGSTAGVQDSVTRKASTFAFKHFPIQTNDQGVWNGPMSPAAQPTTTTYETTVLENGYLRVTILPSYGGRVLSIVHKPTNRELLYQNPLGTPYLMQEGIFYYDYLVIMGGIFPSFPEPEHGRYWNRPYDFDVVNESAEAITVRMSRKDDLDLTSGVPARYDVGRTDVLVELDVTLRAGSSALELSTRLTNTRSAPVPKFEYWTVTTLAPGSAPGQTAIPLKTRILANMEQVRLLESSWAWFGQAEERVSNEIFKWKNLVNFENWSDQGTAFANPQYTSKWSGLSNDENDTAILRVSENVQTPGLKLWTFGKQSLGVDIDDPDEWLRPTIEMWHGVTPEFWNRGTLAANEVRGWTDRYFATLGLKQITAVSDYGALSLSSSASGGNTTLTAAATLTLPNETLKVILRLGDRVVLEQPVAVAADKATTVSATVPTSEAPAGAVFEAEFMQGDKSLLSGKMTLG